MNDVTKELKVVGFEGDFPADCKLTWGAAAIRDGSSVYNALLTYRSKDDEHFHKGILRGYCTALVPPIELQPGQETDGMLVLAIRKDLNVKLEPKHMLASQDQGEWTAYLYQNREQMLKDVQEYWSWVLRNLKDQLDIGFTLSAHCVEANALMAVMRMLTKEDDDVWFKQRGEALLRSDEDREKFRSMFYGEYKDDGK